MNETSPEDSVCAGYARHQRGPVTVLYSGESVPVFPQGFLELDYEPPGEATKFGRGGARPLRWPDGRTCYFREYRHGGLLGGLRNVQYASEAVLVEELLASERLLAKGLRVPRPVVGRIERLSSGVRLSLVTEAIPGDVLYDVLQDEERSDRYRLLRETGRCLRALHATGFRHRDLHPGNLIVGQDGGIAVLDLEGGTFGGSEFDSAAIKSLSRFARYIEKHAGEPPSFRDVWAMLSGYEGERERRLPLLETLASKYARDLRWHRLGWRLFGR